MARDEWVAAAMTDDDMVAELLLRLKQARTTAAENPAVLPPLRWGIRQRRSRSSRFVGGGGGGGGGSVKKVAESARASPMTPLSWSGGSGSGGSASPSAATADGFEETSRQATCSTSGGSGSKAIPANEITSACSKRSKRKKTFSELKDEENSLLKERLDLEKEIATLRATFKEQSARNKNLKRIKLDLNSDCVKSAIPDYLSRERIEDAPETLASSIDPISSQKRDTSLVKDRSNSVSCAAGQANSSDGGSFLLPDLNMTPSEDDSVAETLYGTS